MKSPNSLNETSEEVKDRIENALADPELQERGGQTFLVTFLEGLFLVISYTVDGK